MTDGESPHYIREPARRVLASDAALRVISREGIGASTVIMAMVEGVVPASVQSAEHDATDLEMIQRAQHELYLR